MLQHFREQRYLEFAQGDVVQVVGIASIQVAEVAAHGIRHVVAQWCAIGVLTVGGNVQVLPLDASAPLMPMRRGRVSLTRWLPRCVRHFAFMITNAGGGPGSGDVVMGLVETEIEPNHIRRRLGDVEGQLRGLARDFA